MPGGFEDLEDNIAALRADIKKEHRSRSRHEYEHQRAPEPNYEDKIKLTLAEQRLRDLEDRLERERQERYHHHSPDRSYEDKVKLTLAEQRLRDAEQQLEGKDVITRQMATRIRYKRHYRDNALKKPRRRLNGIVGRRKRRDGKNWPGAGLSSSSSMIEGTVS